jgi:hypothetical protein
MSTTTPAIKAILMLVTIVVVIGIFTGLSNPVVQVLLGFADEATLDDGTKEKYSYLKDINEENINSINALLFSVNAIAHYDTNLKTDTQKEAFLLTMFGQNQERVFGNQVVKYIFSNIEPVQIEKKDSIDVATRKIIDYATRCYYIFEDNGKERSRCYALDMSQADFETNKITEQHIEEQAELYMDSGNCDDTCKETVNLLFLKTNGLRFDLSITGSMKKQEYYFCAEPGGLHANHLWTPRVYLVDSINHHGCDIKDKNKEAIGFKVTNFNMEQDVGPMGFIEDFFLGYKPNVLYYEMADPSITQDYEAARLNFDIGDALKWELMASAMFDFIPYFRPVRKVVGTLMIKAGLKKVASETAEEVGQRFFKEWISEIGEKLSRGSGLKKYKEVFEESFNKFKVLLGAGTDLPPSVIKEIFEGVSAETSEQTVRRAGVRNFIKNNFEISSTTQVKSFLKEALGDKVGREITEEEFEIVSKRITNGYLEGVSDNIAQGQARELTEAQMHNLVADALMLAGREDVSNEVIQNLIEGLVKHNTAMKNTLNRISAKTFSFNIRRVKRAADRLKGSLKKISELSEDKQEKAIKQLLDDNVKSRFGSMLSRRKDLKKFISNNKIPQDELMDAIGNPTNLDKMLLNVKEVPMDKRLRTYLETDISDIKNAVGSPVKKRQLILLFGLWFLHIADENDAEIFHPVGVNSFGYKTSLSSPAIFDDYYRLDWDYETAKGRKDYKDYFKYYGDSIIPGMTDREEDIDPETGIDYQKEIYMSEKYTGTIPEIYNYFVALSKDKRKFYGQSPERFYLISPCKADLNVKVEQLKCYGSPKEEKEGWFGTELFAKQAVWETGRFNPILDERIEHFDGDNTMLYQVDENGDIIKLCPKRNFLGVLDPFENVYTPMSITVDPVLDQAQEMNYCYEGIDEQQVAADAVFNWGIPIGAGLLFNSICIPATGLETAGLSVPICLFVGGAAGGLAGTVGYVAYEHTFGKDQFHWPYHSSGWVGNK